jgi:hypothetical protein
LERRQRGAIRGADDHVTGLHLQAARARIVHHRQSLHAEPRERRLAVLGQADVGQAQGRQGPQGDFTRRGPELEFRLLEASPQHRARFRDREQGQRNAPQGDAAERNRRVGGFQHVRGEVDRERLGQLHVEQGPPRSLPDFEPAGADFQPIAAQGGIHLTVDRHRGAWQPGCEQLGRGACETRRQREGGPGARLRGQPPGEIQGFARRRADRQFNHRGREGGASQRGLPARGEGRLVEQETTGLDHGQLVEPELTAHGDVGRRG